MISVDEALSKIEAHKQTSDPITLHITKCLHYVLAKNVYALINMPPFRQSAMDGYAIFIHENDTYSLVGEIKAGDAPNLSLQKGEAVRIFTGAAVPNSANAVVMQEKTTVKNNILTINETPKNEQNIRPLGEQIKKGTLALTKGTALTPSKLSFLASLGSNQLLVYPKPKVAIVVTGSELTPPGTPLEEGKIYESNSLLLSATLQNEQINDFTIYKVKDDYQSTEDLLKKVIDENDFVLVSGGISVGDYDFVGKALKNLETEEIFYKIKQKPGKPLFFGKKNTTYVFALPGNPASALTCFYIYALPLLRNFSNQKQTHLSKITQKITHDYHVKGIRAQFLKAKSSKNGVEILGFQSSAMIHGFNNANALVFIPENTSFIKSNEDVEVILLP
ncbi:molybdopterin molybdotransferase MoeA [Aquimarina agarilytica]|uniref:molybdopterin molybdotransferase MoeA n=1 Tax=Aquimarina agarilytica TaxID=1087449 RepID=UPI0002892DB2|nr:gephyrin-like molybdotransferase Glp [Aquimarina agarilytica]